ncbi:hypothetical protein [Rubrolithibacter danxiaensis]|uniref:hypothetical protein n=1 Tax=Rubrolithibacter danxiaensis TaxID=3390805 RepID=UPI003BF7A96A
MKNLYTPHPYLLLLSLLLSCSSREKVEITGKANGIKEGVVLIAKGDSIITGENIKENGSFSFIKNIDPGFYDIRLKISGSDNTNSTPVYLEKGKYAVIFDSDPGRYPYQFFICAPKRLKPLL